MRSRLHFYISGMLVMTSRKMHVEISIDFCVYSRPALPHTGNTSAKGFLGVSSRVLAFVTFSS